jgi:anti-sigma factor (TIGR02949 family)
MDCSDVQDYLGAVVDGEIDRNILSSINRHVQVCAGCRNELELERITKHLVKTHVPRVGASRALAANIMAQVARTTPEEQPSRPWYDALTNLLTWRTTFAVSGALAVLVLLTLFSTKSHHSHAQPVDDNVIHQVYNNFDGVLDGKLVPTVSSADPSTVKAFFGSRVNFTVSVPRLKRCALLGGIFSEYKHTCLAHVVYKHGDKLIYVYQTRFKSVMDSGCLQLPAEAKRDLQQTGWYFENHAPDCSLVLWVVDSTLCCAIADIDKEQLLACLRDAE